MEGGGGRAKKNGRLYFIGFYKILLLFPPIVRKREGPIVKQRLVYSSAEPVYCQGYCSEGLWQYVLLWTQQHIDHCTQRRYERDESPGTIPRSRQKPSVEPSSQPESQQLMNAIREQLTLFGSADMYSAGESNKACQVTLPHSCHLYSWFTVHFSLS